MKRLVILSALLTTAAPVWAGEKVLYQPAPDWIAPAPPLVVAKPDDNSPVVLRFDSQQRLQDGQVWSYVDTASRAATTQTLSQVGTVQLPWQPAQGDLIIHTAELIRGNERIDLIKGGDPFTILRREEKLAERTLDGMLTATMAVPGLQLGDVVHFSFSITRKDPTLKGDMQGFAPLIFAPNRLGFGRSRLLWPAASDVKWRAYDDLAGAKPVLTGGYRDLSITLPLAKPGDMPSDAPLRFQRLPLVEATSFADWGAVAKVMAPLYATEGLIAPGSPLAAEVARIAQATNDPARRAGLALQLVQDKISYLLLGMETGNYVPQTPNQTWAARYGDCKAKTLLLLALLHALKIDAQPVLASVKAGALVERRLPMPGAFDHVFVRATIGGETLWLDGTDGGARFADLHDTPDLGWVLPLAADGGTLTRIAARPSARPQVATEVELDERAGLRLPAPFTLKLLTRGSIAELLKTGAAQGTKEQIDQLAAKMTSDYLGSAAVVATRGLTFDADAGTATLNVTGIAYPDWTRENDRLRYSLDHGIGEIDFKPDRARTAWREIPVRTANPEHNILTTRIRLPAGGRDFTIEGPENYSDTLAGRTLDRKIVREGDLLIVTERIVETAAEVAVADIPATRQKIAAAKAKLPFVIAPAAYPDYVAEVEGARGGGRLAPLQALYAKRIADDPELRDRYTDRAWFADRVFDRKAAIADLDRAIALEPTADDYLDRAEYQRALGHDELALKDAEEALKLDPASDNAINRVARLKAEKGEGDAALALVQARIDEGGKDRFGRMATKADLQALTGARNDAIVTMDEAITGKPGDASLLNTRCWLKGTGNLALDTALKDCTKAIELADDASSALDSRAMVYFRLGRMDDALADLGAALEADPDQSGSRYLRGVVLRRQGKLTEGDRELKIARALDPVVDRNYKRWGIIP